MKDETSQSHNNYMKLWGGQRMPPPPMPPIVGSPVSDALSKQTQLLAITEEALNALIVRLKPVLNLNIPQAAGHLTAPPKVGGADVTLQIQKNTDHIAHLAAVPQETLNALEL